VTLEAKEAGVLLIEWVPRITEGSGFPRTVAILRALDQAGFRVVLYPPKPCNLPDGEIYADIPRRVEVIRGQGIDTLDHFLRERHRDFQTMIVSRPMTMLGVIGILARDPQIVSGLRLIYDSEALSAPREILRRRLLGDPPDFQTEEHWMARELALSTLADTVLAVSEQERETFKRFGAKDVRVLGYAISPAPTPRKFPKRRGLLFVGRVAEDGSMNTDSLVWFCEKVFPSVRKQLGERGYPVSLTVAGKTGARILRDGPSDGIEFLGVVDDLRPLYDRARLFVAPTRFAAGIPLKVLDSAAHGLPVIATKLLARQLRWQSGEDLLANEVSDASGFATHIVEAYTNAELWARLRANALARVEQDCSPKEFSRVLSDALRPEERRACLT
jgi:glycosyltransferase involved in cell wall biosynthesis